MLLPGLPELGLEHRAGWAEAEADGTVVNLRNKVGIDPNADPDTAVLAIGDRVLTLPLAVSGSGARYADAEGNELWTKGMEDGRLTLAGEPPRTCVAAK